MTGAHHTAGKTHKSVKHVTSQSDRYVEAIGRRKTAIARVRIFQTLAKVKHDESITVNNKPLKQYFPLLRDQYFVVAPFASANFTNHKTTVKVSGGGVHAQAEAVRLGIARALILINPETRPPLKVAGFLKRDPRKVERKKYGLRKARRAQQWRKR